MSRKICLALLAAVLLAGGLFAAIGNAAVTRTVFVMDTVVTLTLPRRATGAMDACIAELNRLDAMLSAYRADSEVSRVNATAHAAPVPVSDELFALLTRAWDIAQLTDGAFDPAMGAIVDLWDIGGVNNLPSAAAIAAAKECVGYHHLQLSAADNTVYFSRPGVKLNLGGIAKGYAGDRLTKILQSAGVTRAMLDLGGNIVTLAPADKPYTIGLQQPDAPRGTWFTTVQAAGQSVVTSGGYERFFTKDGADYHHIFDPKTGSPARTGVKSVTVISADGTLADALSTALFVQGADRGTQTAQALGVRAIFLTDTGETITVE